MASMQTHIGGLDCIFLYGIYADTYWGTVLHIFFHVKDTKICRNMLLDIGLYWGYVLRNYGNNSKMKLFSSSSYYFIILSGIARLSTSFCTFNYRSRHRSIILLNWLISSQRKWRNISLRFKVFFHYWLTSPILATGVGDSACHLWATGVGDSACHLWRI
jgi:hypothetical protein